MDGEISQRILWGLEIKLIPYMDEKRLPPTGVNQIATFPLVWCQIFKEYARTRASSQTQSVKKLPIHPTQPIEAGIKQ